MPPLSGRSPRPAHAAALRSRKPASSANSTPSSRAPSATSVRSRRLRQTSCPSAFQDARRLQRPDPVRSQPAAGDDEPRQLVARQRPFSRGSRNWLDAQRVEVAGDGVGDLLLAALARPGDGPLRMLFGPAMIIGVMKQPGDGPLLGVGIRAAVARRCPANERARRSSMCRRRLAIGPARASEPGRRGGPWDSFFFGEMRIFDPLAMS